MSGELWTQLITPAELTGYARAEQEVLERRWGSLARYLPNEFVPDIMARFTVGKAGLQPVAPFRSWDTETPLGSLPGEQRVALELPPLGEKLRVSEYDQLRQRDGNARDVQILNSVLKITRQIVRDVSNRIEVARGQAIEFAVLDVDENGFVANADWERDASMEVTASGAGLWADPDDATPLADLLTWVQEYEELNDETPGSILTSRKVILNLARTAEFRNLYATLVGRPSQVNREAINAILANNDLPPIDLYERNAVFDNGDGGGVKKRPILGTSTKLFLLPAAAGEDSGTNGMGATYWGQTLEADEPDYGLQAEEQPGIVAATWKTRDPIGVWVHCNAIGMPVLGDANRAMVATVLPDGS